MGTNNQPVKPKEHAMILALMWGVIIYFLICAVSGFESIFTPFLIKLIPEDGMIQTLYIAVGNIGCLGIIISVMTVFKGRAFYGSFSEASKVRKANIKELNKRVDLGKVQRVSVEQGGFFSNTMSTIETEKGIYRVLGDVGSVTKGELVSKCQNELSLGLAKGKSYTIKG